MTAPSRPAASPSLRTDSAGGRPFARVLIANRGEIAVRIIRTCRDLGIETVAVYSDVDADASHVRSADHAVRLGPAPAAESYLRGDAIIDAALASGAQAVHPGYGFLSERASFARAVIDAGLVFVGPTPDAIDAIGDKVAARRTAQTVGVPVVPGTFEPADIDRPDAIDGIVAAAEAVGFPLLVKAAAGGGGRGMRRVATASELPAALVAGSAEARSAFGDGSVYLEREIRPARHIEVQLLGDRHGTIVALGERDCSIQRRHQKLVEESPAPGLTRDERAELHALAVAAARAAELTSTATAEFLFDGARRPWFLEVNARLQVEHGVTELVSGLDLVAEQLWVAAGVPLSAAVHAAARHAADPDRHALEVRISAEDPSLDFVPTPGRVGHWTMPSGPDVRVDTALRMGERVPPDYDPLLAKVMTVGPDRASAIDRMRRALDETDITGLQTTLPFHRALLADPAFRDADLSTEHVALHWDGAAAREAVRERAYRLAADAVAGRPPRVAGSSSLRKDATPTGWRTAARQEAIDRWPR
ncbi:MAG TPA: biotin carboxylase N-terminal domain-containing protein [Candidatus Saccharimonadales bacterium]|nr:biotin carboxylase N-terminal domain-containing protein [Candidatus Saccharimonadales bacterium]